MIVKDGYLLLSCTLFHKYTPTENERERERERARESDLGQEQEVFN